MMSGIESPRGAAPFQGAREDTEGFAGLAEKGAEPGRENAGEPSLSERVSETVSGRVKFYDANRGMGFLYFDDGSPDAFFHASILNRRDMETILPETTVRAEVVVERGRRRVFRMTDVDESTVTAAAKQAHLRLHQGRQRPVEDPAFSVRHPLRRVADEALVPLRDEVFVKTLVLEVKLFDPSRGFGIFHGDDGLPDVFVHVSTIRACGHQDVKGGETYEVDVTRGDKGLVAEAIRRVGAP